MQSQLNGDIHMSDDERAIRELIATWMEASKAGDTDKVLSLMTDDVVFMVPGQEPFGKQAFRAASAVMAGARIEGKSDIRELKVVGDLAYARSHLQVKMTPPVGNSVERSGYTLSIFARQPDGRWLLARDANLMTGKA